jgi:thiol:disulfide interchange protein DsbC
MRTNETYWAMVRRAAARLVCAIVLAASWPHELPAADSKTDVKATIKQVIESRFPGVSVLDTQPSVIPGLYEVFLGDRIVYADASADYLVMGPLVDTQTMQNLTEVRLNERGKIDFRTLPLDRAIRVVKGDGKRAFAVFSDPDCPFCQQLEQSLLSVTDVTMYVFLFPIASLHPQAPAHARAIWCASDRSQAWESWMHQKKLPSTVKCQDDPVSELQKLGAQLRITSTPTLFFADGRRTTGSIPAAELEKLLDAGSVPRPVLANPPPQAVKTPATPKTTP